MWNAESGGSREHVLRGDVDNAREGAILMVSGRLKSIVKRMIGVIKG